MQRFRPVRGGNGRVVTGVPGAIGMRAHEAALSETTGSAAEVSGAAIAASAQQMATMSVATAGRANRRLQKSKDPATINESVAVHD